MDVLVLADDLTGALEVGTSFAQRGFKAGVYPDHKTKPTDCVSVITTNTRSHQARVGDSYHRLRKTIQAHHGFIYKKVDSALRGQIKQELEQLWYMGFRQFVIAPAYPKLGRETKAGKQYLYGRLVTESFASFDPLSPISTAAIADLLPEIMQKYCRLVPYLNNETLNTLNFASQNQVSIIDISTNEDLQSLAAFLVKEMYKGIIVGSNGLAEAFANEMGSVQQKPERLLTSLLIISGSHHPATHRQLDVLLASDIGVASNLNEDLAKPIYLIEVAREKANPQKVQAVLQQQVYDFLESHKPAGLFIIGGETVRMVLKTLGVDRLYPERELAAGVPLSIVQGGDFDAQLLISKSGGFGDEKLLVQIIEQIMP